MISPKLTDKGIGLKMSMSTEITELCLTPELERLVKAFRSMPDDKMRYKQLLFMASHGGKLSDEHKVIENKVQGCLSTVHVHAFLKDEKVYFEGDSDAQLTKGLLNILIRGLSGNTPQSIQNIKPEFIKVTGLQASLTPGRNNGFVNMLATMKKKALQLSHEKIMKLENLEEHAKEKEDFDEIEGKPITSSIIRKLNSLKPIKLDVEDESGSEDKFYISIVSDAFEGLSLVKRHKLIHVTISDEMKQIHAVQLSTKTPSEAGL